MIIKNLLEISLHMVNLILVKLNSRHEILVVLGLRTVEDVNIAFAESPVQQTFSVDVVHFVQEHPGMKVIQFLRYLITLFIQVIYFYCCWSFDHSTYIWEA